jgi:5-methylcytosine-specific restriction endonuclease McrA
MPFEIEHIIPEVAGGGTEETNLCLACPRCNSYKGTQASAVDDESKASVPLFNPREQIWDEHFAWEENGLFIRGLSAIGRATVRALQLNNSFAVRARYVWITSGWHPPS